MNKRKRAAAFPWRHYDIWVSCQNGIDTIKTRNITPADFQGLVAIWSKLFAITDEDAKKILSLEDESRLVGLLEEKQRRCVAYMEVAEPFGES